MSKTQFKLININPPSNFTITVANYRVGAGNQCYSNQETNVTFTVNCKNLVKSATLRVVWLDDYAKITLNNNTIMDYGYGDGSCHRNEHGTSDLSYSVPVSSLVEGTNYINSYLIRYGNYGLIAYLDITY